MRYVNNDCVICDNSFTVPYYQRQIRTCSEECNKTLKVRQLSKGEYYLCDMCDKPIYRTRKSLKRNNFCSVECDHLYRQTVKGLGVSKSTSTRPRKKYYGENWYKISDKVRELQDFKCLDCNIHENDYGKKLSVHHLQPFVTFDTPDEANKLDNLVAVCEPCHRVRHSGDNHASKFSKDRLGNNAYSGYGKRTHKNREKAEMVLELLINTDYTLTDIAKMCDVSFVTVRRIYRGKRWTELYEHEAPIHIRPRAKSDC